MRWREIVNEATFPGVANTIDAAIQAQHNANKPKKDMDVLAAQAHKRGFRGGFMGMGDDTGIKREHVQLFMDGHALGVKARKRYKGEVPEYSIRVRGFTKRNPALIKLADSLYPGMPEAAPMQEADAVTPQLDDQAVRIMDALVAYLKKQLDAAEDATSYLGSGGIDDDVGVFFSDFRAGAQHLAQLGIRGAVERAIIRDHFKTRFGTSMRDYADQLADSKPQPMVAPAPKPKRRPPSRPMKVQYD